MLLQETQGKLDKVNQKIQEMREESEQVRRDCQMMIQSYQESQENKAHTLGEYKLLLKNITKIVIVKDDSSITMKMSPERL